MNTKWMLLAGVAMAALGVSGPASAEQAQNGNIVIAADDTTPDTGDDAKMDSKKVSPGSTTSSSDGPVNTENKPEGRGDNSEMEEGTVAPDTSSDDTPAQKSDPTAIQEEDSTMDNDEVGDPSKPTP